MSAEVSYGGPEFGHPPRIGEELMRRVLEFVGAGVAQPPVRGLPVSGFDDEVAALVERRGEAIRGRRHQPIPDARAWHSTAVTHRPQMPGWSGSGHGSGDT